MLAQSDGAVTGTGGISLVMGTEWKTLHTGIYYSFVIDNNRVAYVDNTTGAWVQPSSRDLKSKITALSSVLDKALQLNPLSYSYNHDTNATQTFGFIAEEVETLFPELVRYDEQGKPGLSYAGFSPIAIKAIQEQQLHIATASSKL